MDLGPDDYDLSDSFKPQLRARGQHLGRPSKLTRQQQRSAPPVGASCNAQGLAKSYDLGVVTISRMGAT
jgi:hypothetical protein